MIDWQGPIRETERLKAVERSGLIDLPPQHAFDRLIEIAVELTGAPRGVIALVDSEYTTAFSAAGFPEGLPLFAPIDHSFCRFVVATGRPFIVEDSLHDPRTIGDPAIEAFGAVAWIGFPIRDSDGVVLGNFCLMDSEPREWTPRDIHCLGSLAESASAEIALIQARREVANLRRKLDDLGTIP
jgi:sigma-B regulation protein RsbU (phosphoserine phosphatase)